MIFDKSVPQRVPNTPVAEVGYTSPVCVYLLTVLSMEWEAFMQVYWNPSLLRQVWYQHALVCCLMCKLPRYQRSRKELIFSRNFVCRFILVEFICCLILLKNIEIWRSTEVRCRIDSLYICTVADVNMDGTIFVTLKQRERVFFVCSFFRVSSAPAHCTSSPVKSGHPRLPARSKGVSWTDSSVVKDATLKTYST